MKTLDPKELIAKLRRLSTIEFGGAAAQMAVEAMREAADALSALPGEAVAPSRFHLTDDHKFMVQTAEGEKLVGVGWLLITEDEYSSLVHARAASPPPPSTPTVAREVTEGMVEIGLVKQRAKNDCFLCCLCMLTGTPYDAAAAKWGDEFVARIGEHGLYGKEDIATAFGALGMVADEDYKSLLGPGGCVPEVAAKWAVAPTADKLKTLLWGRPALVQVKSKNFAGQSHILYWNGHEVFDPSPLNTYTWDEVDPEHVWIVRAALNASLPRIGGGEGESECFEQLRQLLSVSAVRDAAEAVAPLWLKSADEAVVHAARIRSALVKP